MNMAELEFDVFDRDLLFKARRHDLLREAGRQFSKKGFHGTSMTDIAKGVKLTKSGLFHYVKTKEEMLYLCYEDAVISAEQCMNSALEVNGNALEKICHYIRHHLGQFDQRGGYYVILSELSVLSADNQKKLHTRAKNVDQKMLNLVKNGIKEGSIAKVNPKMALYAIEGALNWVPKWYSHNGEDDITEIAEDFITFFTDGLKAR
jgi:TetR/AcrR family transcriptional regulator